MSGFLVALLITIVAEFGVIWIFLKKEPMKLFAYSALMNLFTLPIATYAYQNVLRNFLIVESCVFLAESILIKELLEIKFKRALLLSFAANAATTTISLVFFNPYLL